jgi:hypothetical protein
VSWEGWHGRMGACRIKLRRQHARTKGRAERKCKSRAVDARRRIPGAYGRPTTHDTARWETEPPETSMPRPRAYPDCPGRDGRHKQTTDSTQTGAMESCKPATDGPLRSLLTPGQRNRHPQKTGLGNDLDGGFCCYYANNKCQHVYNIRKLPAVAVFFVIPNFPDTARYSSQERSSPPRPGERTQFTPHTEGELHSTAALAINIPSVTPLSR